jgi:methylthioribose-1-phosphate isomerase
MRTVKLDGKSVVMIDQSKLPSKLELIRCGSAAEVADAIKQMKIRGAPALGAAAAMALAVTALRSRSGDAGALLHELERATEEVRRTRPTGANLFAGLNRVMAAAREAGDDVARIREKVVKEAQRIADEDVDANRQMGKNGAELVKDGATILTHCNAGALATVDYGTALGVVRAAREQGKQVNVIATETRPLCQGSRLTTWELKRDDIPVTLITDSMVGHVMAQGKVDLVIVGADRIAASGDTANKIGTYTIAVLAKRHGIPFYVAAPTSTIDLETSDGSKIKIEHRDPSEVRFFSGEEIVPEGVEVLNPAFDVTPAELITAIITERGVVSPEKVRELFPP